LLTKVPENFTNILTNWESTSFSRSTQPYGGVRAHIGVSCNNRNNWVCNPGLDPKQDNVNLPLTVMTTAVQYIYYLQTVTCALLQTFSSKLSLKKINITHSPANIQHLDTVISK